MSMLIQQQLQLQQLQQQQSQQQKLVSHCHHSYLECSHIHSRSHSDPTKNNISSPTFFHLKTPESDIAKLATTSPTLESDYQNYNAKKRVLTIGSDSETHSGYTFKRSRTAPPSPPYDIDEDLKLRLPLHTEFSHNERSRSLSPSKYLPTPVTSSDPVVIPSSSPCPSPTHSSPAAVHNLLNTIDEYPDTCYRFYQTQGSNESVESTYNKEWKQRLEILVKADDPHVYSKFKDYCSSVSTKKTEPIKFDSRISSKVQRSKLSNAVSDKYRRNDPMKISSIINFPFENNYTYQSVGYLQDIDVLRNQDASLRKNYSMNLSKYNHIFDHISNSTEYEDDSRRKLPLINSIRRKSQQLDHHSLATGLITTDLPFNFKSSIHQQQLVSPPQQKPVLAMPQQQPQMRVFVNSSRSDAAELSTTARPLPPTTPKQSLLPSPVTSPASKYNTHHHHNHHVRRCISCKSVQSPCWRPSWSVAAGQLCNSCGLRYKKTGAHCLNDKCLRIPLKGEWTLMKNRGKLEFYDDVTKHLKYCYKCLHCGGEVDVNE